jgi:hypothetical protein
MHPSFEDLSKEKHPSLDWCRANIFSPMTEATQKQKQLLRFISNPPWQWHNGPIDASEAFGVLRQIERPRDDPEECRR